MPNLIIHEQTPFEDVNPFHEGCFITLFHIPTQNASFTRDSSASLLLVKGDYKTRQDKVTPIEKKRKKRKRKRK